MSRRVYSAGRDDATVDGIRLRRTQTRGRFFLDGYSTSKSSAFINFTGGPIRAAVPLIRQNGDRGRRVSGPRRDDDGGQLVSFLMH